MPQGMEIIVKDLEKAQRKRFKKAKNKYKFFTNEDERAVFQEILDLRHVLTHEHCRPRGGIRGSTYSYGRQSNN